MNRLSRWSILLVLIAIMGSCSGGKDRDNLFEESMAHASMQLDELSKKAEIKNQNPRNSDSSGKIGWIGTHYDWTEGFFPGTLWLMFDATGKEVWKERAAKFQNLYVGHRGQKNDHDLGFIFNCSFGQGYRLTGNESYKQVLVDAANSLMKSYNPTIGLIMSWDVKQQWVKNLGWQYPVIIDNMMNLELLFKATRFTGDSAYWAAAVSHANITMKNHFRDDFSSYHVLDYDSITGEVLSKQTNQGYADESAWARGQAWGLYGYCMCYRYTKDEKYLNHANLIASYLMNQENMPPDKIPYWDYNDPSIPKTYRDASAAAVMASALLELDGYSRGHGYYAWAFEILQSLFQNYTNRTEDSCKFILKHSVGNYPKKSELDVGINYADYYYMEALLRLKNMNEHVNFNN